MANIHTKFDIGDVVHTMSRNNILTTVITDISIRLNTTPEIIYTLLGDGISVTESKTRDDVQDVGIEEPNANRPDSINLAP